MLRHLLLLTAEEQELIQIIINDIKNQVLQQLLRIEDPVRQLHLLVVELRIILQTPEHVHQVPELIHLQEVVVQRVLTILLEVRQQDQVLQEAHIVQQIMLLPVQQEVPIVLHLHQEAVVLPEVLIVRLQEVVAPQEVLIALLLQEAAVPHEVPIHLQGVHLLQVRAVLPVVDIIDKYLLYE